MMTTKKDFTLKTIHDVMIEAVRCQTLQDVLADDKGKVSQRLIELAQGFYKGKIFVCGHAPNARAEFKGEADGFLGACFKEEQWVRSNEAGEYTLERLPRAWIQAKSNILAAHKAGVNIEGHTTESSLRTATAKAKEGKQGTEKSGKGTKAVESDKITTDIDGILGVLQHVYQGLDDKGKDKLKAALIGVHTAYAKMIKTVLPRAPVAPAPEYDLTNLDAELKEALKKVG